MCVHTSGTDLEALAQAVNTMTGGDGERNWIAVVLGLIGLPKCS